MHIIYITITDKRDTALLSVPSPQSITLNLLTAIHSIPSNVPNFTHWPTSTPFQKESTVRSASELGRQRGISSWFFSNLRRCVQNRFLGFKRSHINLFLGLTVVILLLLLLRCSDARSQLSNVLDLLHCTASEWSLWMIGAADLRLSCITHLFRSIGRLACV